MPLVADPKSGYEWRLAEPPIRMVVAEGPPTDYGFNLTPVRAGDERLRIEYRPVEGTGPAQRTVSYDVRVLENFSQLPPFIAEMAAAGVTDLFVSSGDGTVQAIQTEIAERLAPTFFPRLTLLPHGTTNMTAADLGFRNHNVNVQADFIANREPRVPILADQLDPAKHLAQARRQPISLDETGQMVAASEVGEQVVGGVPGAFAQAAHIGRR